LNEACEKSTCAKARRLDATSKKNHDPPVSGGRTEKERQTRLCQYGFALIRSPAKRHCMGAVISLAEMADH
jgi:hypothetical protein